MLFSINQKENEHLILLLVIVSDTSTTKGKTLTSLQVASPYTPNEITIIGNAILARKKPQAITILIPLTPETPTYKAKDLFRKHLFSCDFFL